MKKLIYKVTFIAGGILSFFCIVMMYIFCRVSLASTPAEEVILMLIYPALFIAIAFFSVSAVVAFLLSKYITGGIEKINFNDPESRENFIELRPVIKRLKEQNDKVYLQKEKLRARKKEFSAITENMSEGFLLVDQNMHIISNNHSAVRFLQNKREETELKLIKCDKGIIRSVEQALAGERTQMVLNKDGKFYEVIASPVVSDGQVVGAVVIIMDVTEKQQREELRREFSANVSHELKTPLTSITGFSELMRDGLVKEDKIKEFSNDIYNEAKRLLELVNDIIRLSKLDEGSVVFEEEKVDLLCLCQEIIYELYPIADKNQVTIEVTGAPTEIIGVKQILREMIMNMCDNAVKYNKNGGKVAVSVGKEAEGTPFIKVIDTGIGIPLSHQNRVFERFYRVDKSHSKEIGGTGLGLSIVKHAAAYHGATVTLKSEVDIGTEITVSFKN